MFQVSHMILRNFMYIYMYIEKMVIIHSWYIYIFFSSESVRRRSSAQKDNCSNVTVETKDGYVVSLCEELDRIYLGDVEDPNNSSELLPLSRTIWNNMHVICMVKFGDMHFKGF